MTRKLIYIRRRLKYHLTNTIIDIKMKKLLIEIYNYLRSMEVKNNVHNMGSLQARKRISKEKSRRRKVKC